VEEQDILDVHTLMQAQVLMEMLTSLPTALHLVDQMSGVLDTLLVETQIAVQKLLVDLAEAEAVTQVTTLEVAVVVTQEVTEDRLLLVDLSVPV
jgi:hypothetical protein